MFGVAAFILFVIAAIVGWNGSEHTLSIVAAGLACLAIEGVFAWRPWVRP